MNKALHVQHSGRTLDLSAIEDLFSTVGDVEQSHVEINPDSANGSKVGILVMSTEQQASDCAERFHGHIVNGYALSVNLRRPKNGFNKLQKRGLMAVERCKNMNHGRSNVSVRHCPNCGEIVNKKASGQCDEKLHAARRKERNAFCCDCGKKLRT